MTIKDLYQSIVNDMTELDKSIEYLKGKREALNSIRLDLRSMIDEDLGEKHEPNCGSKNVVEEQTGEQK